MSVLLLGGAGFIGAPTAKALRALGHETIPTSRRGDGEGGVALYRGDFDGLKALVRERGVTTVIDFLGYTLVDTQQVMDALDGLIERYVLVGSADVYRNYEGFYRKAEPPVVEGALDEASPLRTTRYPYRGPFARHRDDPRGWLDSYEKLDLEEALARRPGLGGVVLRLPMVYGPGDRNRRFNWIIEPMCQPAPRIGVDEGWGKLRLTYGYVDDVASAIALAATHADAKGRTFNVGETDPPTHDDWITRFADLMGAEPEIVYGRFPVGDPLAAMNLTYPLVLDTSAIRQTLGWSEPTPLPDALRATVADLQQRGFGP